MIEDDGHAVSYKVVKRGTPVQSSDGVQLGTVRRTEEAAREHIFDGIVIDTPAGKRFVDAPEVARIAERAVTLTFPAAQADRYLIARGPAVGGKMARGGMARRVKKLGDRAKDAWNRR